MQAETRSCVNLARIDLVSLRLVVLCVELGSLSAAARRGHLSVSGASHRISCLEDTLGVALFQRRRKGLQPTTAGEIVATSGRVMLEVLEQLTHSLTVGGVQQPA